LSRVNRQLLPSGADQGEGGPVLRALERAGGIVAAVEREQLVALLTEQGKGDPVAGAELPVIGRPPVECQVAQPELGLARVGQLGRLREGLEQGVVGDDVAAATSPIDTSAICVPGPKLTTGAGTCTRACASTIAACRTSATS